MRVNQDLDYYRRQPYGRVFEIRTEGDERYLLYRIKEIPEIAGDGLTKDEALHNLREAFDDYMTWALEEQLEIVPPARVVTSDEHCAPSAVTRRADGVASVTAEPEVLTAGPDAASYARRRVARGARSTAPPIPRGLRDPSTKAACHWAERRSGG